MGYCGGLGALLVAVTSMIGAASASPLPGGEATVGTIENIRRDLVYVDLGRIDGLSAGDRIDAGQGRELEIVALGERQLSARLAPAAASSRSTHGRSARQAKLKVGAKVSFSPAADGSGPTKTADGKRPVILLPSPRPLSRPQIAAIWERGPKRRSHLIPTPGGRQDAPQSSIRGAFTVTWIGWRDGSDTPLTLNQFEVRSRLAISPDGAPGLDYSHDISGRHEWGPNLDKRAGAGSRPNYRVRRLQVRWRSPRWRNSQRNERRAGGVETSLGRMSPGAPGGVGMVDGAQVRVGLGSGFAVGLHGGVAPSLLSGGFEGDTAVVGASASWRGEGASWRGSASVGATTRLFGGGLDRFDLGATSHVAWGRLLDVHLNLVATAVPAKLVPDQPSFSLSRAMLAVRVHALSWMTIDAMWIHDRLMMGREVLSRLGPLWYPQGPRELGRLQLRFQPMRLLDIVVSGSYGFGDEEVAATWSAGGRARLRDLLIPGSSVSLGYHLRQTTPTLAQVADVAISLPLGEFAALDIGYAFNTFLARRLNERQDEHRLDAGVDLLLDGAWRAHVRGSFGFGDLPNQLLISTMLSWRFR